MLVVRTSDSAIISFWLVWAGIRPDDEGRVSIEMEWLWSRSCRGRFLPAHIVFAVSNALARRFLDFWHAFRCLLSALCWENDLPHTQVGPQSLSETPRPGYVSIEESFDRSEGQRVYSVSLHNLGYTRRLQRVITWYIMKYNRLPTSAILIT